MFLKNTSGQKFYVFAFDSTTGLPKTGDQANITVYVAKDYGSPTQTADTSVTQVDATNDAGTYLVDASQAETNAEILKISGKSSTSNIVVIGAPVFIEPKPAAVNTDVATILSKVNPLTFTVANEVNANARYIKGQLIAGSGSSGDPWHP
jgi:hypothetical protein